MKLTPSDIYTHYRPSKCDLRIFLKNRGVATGVQSPYLDVLLRLGHRHEQEHLAIFPTYQDLSGIDNEDELLESTTTSVLARVDVIYQPLLKSAVTIAGIDCEVSGRPDFLIRDDLGYRIRDSKISRRINQKDHPEIILQLQTYAWLFERMFDVPAFRIEVHNGPGEIIEIPYEGPDPVVNGFREIVQIRSLQQEPFAPVKLSKCGGCGYYENCWTKAEATRSVSLVVGVDQGLAFAFHEQGILTMDQLLEKFDSEELAEVQRRRGTKLVRVGTAATSILRNAKALATGQQIALSKPEIPLTSNFVMFDLEGLPPQLDEFQKVYLWGMQVFGEKPSEYISSTAGFGVYGDREGWEGFLEKAAQIFDEYGDISFVHWATYEATLITVYLERFGDGTGRAARVQKNLLNLLPITERSIVLPLPGYSLKRIEKYIGFERTQDEYGGNWSMAKYIEATETQDLATRESLMDAIRTYNREDLEATWAVLEWLLKLSN